MKVSNSVLARFDLHIDLTLRLRTAISAVAPLASTFGFRETRTWRKCRHQMSLILDERTNSHFTGFLRLPGQFEVLTGLVGSSLAERVRTGEPLKIAVIGCSNGAEAFTIASVLHADHPGLAFEVRGIDISADHVRKARTARFEASEIFNNRLIPPEFVRSTFNPDGDAFVVKDDIVRRVRFDVADVRNRDLVSTLGPIDIVFAQNVLFHLTRREARLALDHIGALRPGSTLFLDGVDLDLRARFTRDAGLIPVTCLLKRIHDEARRARAAGWPYQYWGLEPFEDGPNAARRYATIFQRPNP